MTMEASTSPIGDEGQLTTSEVRADVIDLTAIEEGADVGVTRHIESRWVVLAGSLIEVVVVLGAIAWLSPPASLGWAVVPFVLLAMGSVRFRRERLQHRIAERTAAVAIRLLVVGAALTPIAILHESVGALVLVLGMAILTSATMTLVLARLSRTASRRTLIVGAGPVTVDIADHIVDDTSHNLDLIGILESDRSPVHRHPVVGHPEDLLAIAGATAADVVIVSYGPFAPEDLVTDLRQCASALEVYVVPRFFELGRYSDSDLDEINGYPLLRLSSAATSQPSWLFKRLIDIGASSLLLIAFAPLMALIAVAVRGTSPGPALFRQKRVGRDEALFEILKFRTMTVNDDADTTWTVENDPRVTRIGAFLRASHLDELPQLINVLRGDMSLVGPRPERPFFVDQFQQEHDRYGDRHRVLPGVSGWSQVNGLWGDTSVSARARLDNRYIEDWSLFNDLVIMLKTIPTLFKGRG